MQTNTRWLFALVAAAILVAAGTCGVIWQLMRQEQALAREQRRERLENAASLVARESERAWEQATGKAESSLLLEWDKNGVRRTAGAPLLWSPRPAVVAPASGDWFARAEALEFGQQKPAEAIGEYTALLQHKSVEVRAGALLRIARCQRRLGRLPEALRTYEQLTVLGAAPVPLGPAAWVGHFERAQLFEGVGDKEAASQELLKLKACLEQGPAAVDRATFEFFQQHAGVDPRLIAWAEAATAVYSSAEPGGKGAELLEAGGTRFAAAWEGDGASGRGRLIHFDAIRERTAAALAGTAVQWELVTGTDHKPVRPGLWRGAAETGLPWGVRVSLAEPESGQRVFLLAAGLALAGLTILATLYLAYRAVRRELQAVSMQSDFLASVSHEFRSPITAITHLTDLLAAGITPEERRPLYYQALAKETRRLRDMVENLLDFGRMEAGRFRYRPEPLDAAEVTAELLEDFRTQPVASQHTVRLETPQAVVPLIADREALRRALWNLLENAAKYSPAGSTVQVRVSNADGHVELSVADEGPGILPEERKRIFQKFVRGRGAADSGVKGTGIGLAMVDAIARGHGGRVELKSEPGVGSRFCLILPQKGNG